MSRGHVIGLGSLQGAGKSELAEQVVSLGAEYLHVGTIVRATAQANGFVPAEETREAYLPFWGQYTKNHGQDWLARVAFEAAEESGIEIVWIPVSEITSHVESGEIADADTLSSLRICGI